LHDGKNGKKKTELRSTHWKYHAKRKISLSSEGKTSYAFHHIKEGKKKKDETLTVKTASNHPQEGGANSFLAGTRGGCLGSEYIKG